MIESDAAVLVAFIPFGIVAFIWNLYLLRSKHAGRKRWTLRLGLPLVAVVTTAWLVLTTGDVLTLVVSLAVIAAIVVGYFRSVRFCDACGRTVYGPSWLTPPTVCCHCGAALRPGA
jgi:hypothetical protein